MNDDDDINHNNNADDNDDINEEEEDDKKLSQKHLFLGDLEKSDWKWALKNISWTDRVL